MTEENARHLLEERGYKISGLREADGDGLVFDCIINDDGKVWPVGVYPYNGGMVLPLPQ